MQLQTVNFVKLYSGHNVWHSFLVDIGINAKEYTYNHELCVVVVFVIVIIVVVVIVCGQSYWQQV